MKYNGSSTKYQEHVVSLPLLALPLVPTDPGLPSGVAGHSTMQDGDASTVTTTGSPVQDCLFPCMDGVSSLLSLPPSSSSPPRSLSSSPQLDGPDSPSDDHCFLADPPDGLILLGDSLDVSSASLLPQSDDMAINDHPLAPQDNDQGAQQEQSSGTASAFSESPQVRSAYLQAALGNVFGSLSVPQATILLNSALNSLLIAGVLPTEPKPARSLVSAKRRLGIDPDEHIILYAVCPVCWKHTLVSNLNSLASPACIVNGCNGKIYEERMSASGNIKRVAFKKMRLTRLLLALSAAFSGALDLLR